MTLRKTSLWATLVLGASTCLHGQAVSPSTNDATKTSSNDESVVLSPFTVDASEDHGYAATSTLAGTRIKTDLRDVGAAISVVTKDFLQDTGATNAGTLLTYTTNTEVAGVHGNYSGFGNSGTISENYLNPQSTTRVRGLDNADNTRDYFLSSIPWDSFNIDRVDTVRGANSILYGLGSPAGIINTNLNEPFFRNQTTIEARFGRFNSGRASIDSNVVVIPKELAVRFDAEDTRTKYEQKPAFNNDGREYLAIEYKPSFLNTDKISTIIKANVEHGEIKSNNPEESPPDDLITPWFDPTKGNKFVSDPIADWSSNGLGPTWTFHGIINQDPATAIPTGKGQGSNADGTPNPYYQPWLSTAGFQGGTTLLTGNSPQTPLGLTFWQPNVSIGNYPSALNNSINGIPYSQVNGVAGYATYAKQAGLPIWQSGLYKDHSLTDPSIFDFYHNMIQGDNARQSQNWTAESASLSQTFFDDRFGYEAVVHKESYSNAQWSIFGGPGSINVVTDQYNVDGSLNGNFGKPFITGNGRYSNNSLDETRDDARVTAYAEVRGEDLFGRDSLAARLFGKQRFTGLYSYDKDYQNKKSWALFATDANYNSLYNQGTSQVQNLLNYAPNIVSFLGPSMFSDSTAAGANLSAASKITVPTDGATEQFIAKWIAPSTVDPSAAWTPPLGQGGTVNADNPANYQGWTTVPVHVLSALNGDESQLYTGGQKNQTSISSRAVTWQGFFLDGDIVPLVGLRRDTVKTSYAQPAQNANGTFNLDDTGYTLGSPTIESGTTKTYSVVLHVPKQLRNKLPLGLDVSVFYNQSQNFQPGQGRTDVYGNALADPSGHTKDYGVLIALLDQRVTFKVNHFHTTDTNATLNGLQTYDLGASVLWNWEFDQFYKNDFGQGWQNHFAQINGQTADQAATQQANATAAVDALATDPLYQKFVKAWRVTETGTAWQTTSGNYTAPAGFSQTQDTDSKGWEYELTTNITPNWTLTANASKTNAAAANVGGAALNEWVSHWSSLMNGPAGDIRLWWGGSTTTSSTDFTGSFLSGYQLAQLGAGADVSELRPWHYNAVSTYHFDKGVVKGFSFGGGYRWASRDILGYPATLDSNNVFHFDLAHPYYGRDERGLDLWTGYDLKPGRKTTWHFQLNLRNVFPNRSLIPITVEPDGTPAAYKIPDPFGWEFTTRVTF